MIAGMRPALLPGQFQFCTLTDVDLIARALPFALAMFREEEGVSLIIADHKAAEFGLPLGSPMRQITLTVFSSLDGVGLTAAIAGMLADHGIACNMVSAYHHDHAFVPAAMADRALSLLAALAAATMAAPGGAV